MALLDQLVHTYGAILPENLTMSQLGELRDGLSRVTAAEVTSLETARSFLELLRKFRESVAGTDRLHGENYPQLLQSLLSVGEDGVYSDPLRFLFELIQNVDDCVFPSDTPALDIHFDFNHSKIVLRYNEEGFSPFNVFAITGIAEAAKNITPGAAEIGEKGIGFKSVFGIADAVLIRSGWFSFTLRKDHFTIPIPTYEGPVFCSGTEMTLFVPERRAENIYGEITERYCKTDALFGRNPLLFLNKLNSLKLYYDGYRSMEFHVSRTELPAGEEFFQEQDVKLSVDLRDYENGLETRVQKEITCVRYTQRSVFSRTACKARYGDQTKIGQAGGREMVLQVVFPLPEHVDTVGNGTLYSFLPTQLRLSAPLACHVPFKLDGSREFVDSQENNLWFREACQAFSTLLDHAYQEWARLVKTDIVLYLPRRSESLFERNNGKEKCLSGQDSFKGAHFSNLPVFYTVNGHFVGIDKIFTFDSNEKIFNPRRASEFLPVSRELFLAPKGGGAVGIHTERNIYHQLFSIALQKAEKTADVLAYLADAGFAPGKGDVPESSFSLTLEQIMRLMQWEPSARLLREHAQERLKKGMRPVFQVNGAAFVLVQEVLDQGFTPEDTPKRVEEYLKFCGGSCALADIEPDQYLPCHNGLILSEKKTLSSFSAFCFAVDSTDTFSIRMKNREISERLNRISESDEGGPEDYLRELRLARQNVKEAIGDRQYRNYIDLIVKTGTDSMRFIQELLQNADDCAYAEGVTPEFTLTQEQRQLIVQYNERGFTRGNIRSITAIGESTKNYLLQQGTAQIGEKGVGFKAIFSVADRVQIHSGKYHFSLSAKEPTIPKPLPQCGDTDGTRMEITLKPGVSLSSYNASDLLELCLCLRRLRRIHINKVDITINDRDGARTVSVNNRPHTFQRFVHRFSVDPETRRERENGLRSISADQSIICYIPDKGTAKDYPLYSGLPTRHRIKIPLVIDAPFMLTTSREEIDLSGVRWNDCVRREMYAALLSIMGMRRNTDRYEVLRFARFVPRRQGTQTVYANDISDCKYLTDYDYLLELRTADLLPTFQKELFVSAKSGAACRYPEAVNHLFVAGSFGRIAPETALDLPREESLDSVLNALGCREAPFSKTFSVLREYVEGFMGDAGFRKKLYACLEAAPEDWRQSLRELPVIPVYSMAGDGTEYISWREDAIFVKRGCRKSEHSCYILNEESLTKQSCERIFDVNINEMNAELERSRYNEALRKRVRGSNMEEIYGFLLREYTGGALKKYQSREMLMGMREYIPMKNQLGKLVDTGVYRCDKETGYFCSSLIQAVTVHDECKDLAEYLDYRFLSEIHYQDLLCEEDLTADDIEDLDPDYFVNREEILLGLYRDGWISDELFSQCGLDYINMQSTLDDEDWEFPEKPVRNFKRLRASVQEWVRDPPWIIPVKVERTVHRVRYSTGEEKDLEIASIRRQTLAIYTPEGKHGCAVCQMCQKLKAYEFMEVNHILAQPKHFFRQTRVALCLECSKRFEALRSRWKRENQQGGENHLVLAIQQARFAPTDGFVDIRLSEKESIRFTATHLAEIQEILRSVPD